MHLTSSYNTNVFCQDGTLLRVWAGPDASCHCYPPRRLLAGADGASEPIEAPSFWSVYDNGDYYAFIPVALVKLFISEHGGEKPVLGVRLPFEQLLVTPAAPNPNLESNTLRPRTMDLIRCQDGTTLSVQAAEGKYCRPNTNEGPWTAVEVGRVSTEKVPRNWRPYFNGGVFAFIPVTKVRAFIAAHGGEQPLETPVAAKS